MDNNRESLSMRKVKLIIVLLLTIFIAASCKSVSYVSRSMDINRENAKQEKLSAELQVNLNQKVSAASDMQDSKKAAIISAYYNCINNNNIDVVVDPIIKMTKYSVFTSRSMKNTDNAKWWVVQFKAEITGYGGKYVKAETEKEQIQKYDSVEMNSVIKYKMINDPEFYKSYYNNQKTNNVIFNSGNNVPAKKMEIQPVVLQNSLNLLKPAPSVKPINYSEMLKKGKTTRNVGITLATFGVVLLAPVGATVMCVEDDLAGVICMGIGGGLTAIGIGCIAGGVVKMKKAKKANVSLAYNVAPNGAQLSLAF